MSNTTTDSIEWTPTAPEIEDRRSLEAELAHSERKFAELSAVLDTLQSESPVGLGFIDREFRLRSINGPLAEINGAPLADQLGVAVSDLIPDLWPQVEPLYRRVLDRGDSIANQEITGITPSDPEHVHTWLASYSPVRVNREIIGIGVVVVDISERKRDDALRVAVMDTMVEGLFALDGDGQVRFVNQSAVKILGWTEEDLRSRSMHANVHHQHGDGSPRPEQESIRARVCSGGHTIRMTDDAFTRKDGTIVPVTYSAAPLVNGPQIEGAVVVFRDTTAERADEERVQRELDSLSWVGRIREAIDEDRLMVYSQPIVPLRGGQCSQELLIRMRGREGEVILPGSFIPIAERYGMISEIDRWVLRQAVRVAAQGRRVEANVSAQSFAPLYLLPLIERDLQEAGADPANLVFEITETALMQDVDAGEVFAQGLADIGCGLSLDDFGTGFASFTYLKRLPLESLKIDIEFIRDLPRSTANQHIVQSIVQLARGFGYDTIAEGVEDEETLSLLRTYGVDYAQGYHLGVPAPLHLSPHRNAVDPDDPSSQVLDVAERHHIMSSTTPSSLRRGGSSRTSVTRTRAP
jgi:PAS domain S-box-containing protein